MFYCVVYTGFFCHDQSMTLLLLLLYQTITMTSKAVNEATVLNQPTTHHTTEVAQKVPGGYIYETLPQVINSTAFTIYSLHYIVYSIRLFMYISFLLLTNDKIMMVLTEGEAKVNDKKRSTFLFYKILFFKPYNM